MIHTRHSLAITLSLSLHAYLSVRQVNKTEKSLAEVIEAYKEKIAGLEDSLEKIEEEEKAERELRMAEQVGHDGHFCTFVQIEKRIRRSSSLF